MIWGNNINGKTGDLYTQVRNQKQIIDNLESRINFLEQKLDPSLTLLLAEFNNLFDKKVSHIFTDTFVIEGDGDFDVLSKNTYLRRYTRAEIQKKLDDFKIQKFEQCQKKGKCK